MDLLRDLLFLPPGVSTMADEIDGLHFFVIGVTMAGSFGIFAAALVFLWRYHRSRRGLVTERVRAPVWFEVITIGGLLGLFVSWWVLGFTQYARMRTPPQGATEIHVVARQWMWKFADASGRRSESVLVVPRDEPVRLILSSRDVIHSFYVPAFRLKQDVVPGRYTSLWFEARRSGAYPVYCAEYCGTNHSRMRATLVVLDPADYERWLEGDVPRVVARAGGRVLPRAREDMATRGERLAVRYGCTACHSVDGQPHIAPSWRGLFGSTRALSDGTRVQATEDYLTESMMEPEAARVRGFEAVMPSYRGVLPAADVGALVEYIKSLREPATEPPVVDLPAVEPLEEGHAGGSISDLDAGVAPSSGPSGAARGAEGSAPAEEPAEEPR